ncbi:MAG TPA: hypothetical protein VMH86_09990 [Rhizomicrobium sp.]|nr:hypothetical protein [Rhizomicrobium sp.]
MRLVLTAALFLTVSTVEAAPPGWVTFKDPDAMFTVSLPRPPRATADSVTNTDGKQIAIRAYKVDRGDNMMLVIVSDFARYTDAVPSKVVAGAVAGLQKSATLVSQTSDRIGRERGQHVSLTDKSGNTIDDRIFFVGGRLYQVMYVTQARPSSGLRSEMRRYTRSFRFTRH